MCFAVGTTVTRMLTHPGPNLCYRVLNTNGLTTRRPYSRGVVDERLEIGSKCASVRGRAAREAAWDPHSPQDRHRSGQFTGTQATQTAIEHDDRGTW